MKKALVLSLGVLIVACGNPAVVIETVEVERIVEVVVTATAEPTAELTATAEPTATAESKSCLDMTTLEFTNKFIDMVPDIQYATSGWGFDIAEGMDFYLLENSERDTPILGFYHEIELSNAVDQGQMIGELYAQYLQECDMDLIEFTEFFKVCSAEINWTLDEDYCYQENETLVYMMGIDTSTPSMSIMISNK